MRIALLILCAVIVTAIVAYWISIPRNGFFIFSRPGGGSMTFSRTGVSFQSAPDHYASNGFDHLEPYISKLLATTNGYRFLHIFTPDGKGGFLFSARDGAVEASLTVEWRQEAQREATIREFFSSLRITPSQDYLAGNGGVPDATRVLAYRISGSSGEVTALTKRILGELCGIAPTDALDIKYGTK
jgi:hypothetical protein